MKFCKKCGKQIVDEAVICTHCGCAVNGLSFTRSTVAKTDEESPTLATLAFVFAFLMPIVGLVMGIIGVVTYKADIHRNKSTVSIIISVCMWIFYFLIYYIIILFIVF